MLFDPAGASGLPCYCAPLVCVPVVIWGLVVWWYNKPRSRKTFKLWAAAASQGSRKPPTTGWPRALCMNVIVRMLIILVLLLPLLSSGCVITLISAEVRPTWMSPSPRICARVCAHVKYTDDNDWFSSDANVIIAFENLVFSYQAEHIKWCCLCLPVFVHQQIMKPWKHWCDIIASLYASEPLHYSLVLTFHCSPGTWVLRNILYSPRAPPLAPVLFSTDPCAFLFLLLFIITATVFTFNCGRINSMVRTLCFFGLFLCVYSRVQ